MSDSIQKLNVLQQDSRFVFAVFYRGHWCPFCLSYIRSLVALQPAITAAGGTAVIITAEVDTRLPDVRAATGYMGEAINDPDLGIVHDLKKRGLVDVAISEKSGYKNGMTQPAVLVMTKEGKVLEKWAIVPGMMNLGGASDRPILEEIWQNVEAKLNNKSAVHSQYSSLGVMRLLKQKIFG